MNANYDEKLEKALIEALKLREEGGLIPEILNLLPEFKEELKEIFQAVEILSREKENIIPSQEILAGIISKISAKEGVTNKEIERYLYGGGTKGRPSILKEVLNIIESMLTKWKVILPVGVAAVIALVILVTQFTGRETTTSLSLSEIAKEQESLDNLGTEIDQYKSEELALDEIDSALEEAAAGETPGVAPTPTPATKTSQPQDPFGLASIQSESKGVGFDSELDIFFSEETGLGEIDAALTDF